VIIADGFSCREQIAQCTDRHALHLAEVLQMALRNGGEGPPKPYPERERVQQRQREIRSSMLQAASVLAGIAATGSLLWALRRSRD
jgi:hypothetical protein